MKEHLEVINHIEALTYVRGLAEKKNTIHRERAT
jgi:hypothetical protein